MKKISKNILEESYQNMRFFVARTGAKDTVSIEGSMHGGWNMLPKNMSEVPDLAAELFDAGTKKRTKNEIRETLSSKGASISFSAGGDRTFFSASCLPEDVSFVLKLIVECISEASFPATEIKNAKERALAEIEEEENQTTSQAAGELSRLIYEPSHANYIEKFSDKKERIQSVTRANLIAFRKMLGKGGFVLAVTGDVSSDSLLKEIKNICIKLPKGTIEISKKEKNKKVQKGLTKLVPIKDKANIDVYVGTSIPLLYTDTLYIPFVVLCEMLGGRGFTSHLMQTVRERDGLTYGVYASAGGFAGEADGYFRVWATFSPHNFQDSVKTLKNEIAIFFAKKITKENLELRKIEMAGGYVVALSTSRALASMLHKIGIENKKLEYIDEYPEILKSITITEVQKAAELIHLEKLSLAAAGTFSKKA